jgi:hypothetical protein
MRKVRSLRWLIFACALLAALSLNGPASAAGGREPLEMYTGIVDGRTVSKLVREGYDIASAREVAGGVEVDLVLTAGERKRLARQGIELELLRNARGQTVRQQAEAQSAYGFDVWRSFDEPGGIRDELYQIAQRNQRIVKLEVIGHSLEGREIHRPQGDEGRQPARRRVATGRPLYVKRPRP